MLRLKIESGRIFLDEKELTGVKELDLHIAGNYPPELKLVMNLDPELLIDQTCDHAGGN